MDQVAAIVVTHDSGPVLDRCIASLQTQNGVDVLVLIVDAGSRNPAYLDSHAGEGVAVFRLGNLGFARANNYGWQQLPTGIEWVTFLNPDAFPAPDALDRAITYLQTDKACGCLTGRLLGYDPAADRPTGRLDSTGIFRSWYGRWYDRGQGEPDRGQYLQTEEIPAACGAFLVCRQETLQRVALAGRDIFAPEFFLYKEDIELSLRMRRQGLHIVYHPDVHVYHCRGWQGRQTMSRERRLLAARSELLLYRRHPSPYLVWALLKYGLVRYLDV